jgi:dTDP-4-amino-4,6-dideoxygalactose transaminase
MHPKIWLSPPHMSGKELGYVKSVFDSNWVAPLGPMVDGFEQDLSGYLGIGHVTVLSSGTAALHLALMVLGIGPGDEVLVSTFSFIAAANPILYQGATPVLIDSEPESWNMDPGLLEEAIHDRIRKGKKPAAIIVVHIYGMPASLDRILAIAAKFEIPVVEDAAEALGSRYNGKHCGTFGIFGVLSFNGNKIITTSGGGALVSDQEEPIATARYLSMQARDNAPHYQHGRIGNNYRLSNVLAAIGRGQMEVLEERIAARRRIHQAYKELLSDLPGITFLEEPGPEYFSNHWLTCISFSGDHDPPVPVILREALQAGDIETRPLMKPIHMQPFFSGFPVYSRGVSEDLFRTGLCLPSGSALTENDLERISGIIHARFPG